MLTVNALIKETFFFIEKSEYFIHKSRSHRIGKSLICKKVLSLMSSLHFLGDDTISNNICIKHNGNKLLSQVKMLHMVNNYS